MKKIKYILILFSIFVFSGIFAASISSPPLTVQEEDGSPLGIPIYKIKVSNDSLTINADGSASISTGGGTGVWTEGSGIIYPTSASNVVTLQTMGAESEKTLTIRSAPTGHPDYKIILQGYDSTNWKDVFYIENVAAGLIHAKVGTYGDLLFDHADDGEGNFERGFARWSGDVFTFGTEKSGSGTLRPLQISASDIVFTQGTAPASAANVVKLWTQDYAAGDSRLYLQSEAGNPIIVGSNEFQLYNTADLTTNYERGGLKWESNVLKLVTEKGGSGERRNLSIILDPGLPHTFIFSPYGTGQVFSITGYSVGTGNFYTTMTETNSGNSWSWGMSGASGYGAGKFFLENTTQGKIAFTSGANGEMEFRNGVGNLQSMNVKALTELTTITTDPYTDTAIQIPVNSIVLAVSGRVTVQPPGTTTVDCGVAGATTRYANAVSSADTTTWPGTIDGTRAYTSATYIRITPNTSSENNNGRIRITVHYLDVTPPSS